MSCAGKPKLRTVLSTVLPAQLSTDEQALLAAYRGMDDEGKDNVASFASLVKIQCDRRRPALRLIKGGRP